MILRILVGDDSPLEATINFQEFQDSIVENNENEADVLNDTVSTMLFQYHKSHLTDELSEFLETTSDEDLENEKSQAFIKKNLIAQESKIEKTEIQFIYGNENDSVAIATDNESIESGNQTNDNTTVHVLVSNLKRQLFNRTMRKES